jgi:hypothetical protein
MDNQSRNNQTLRMMVAMAAIIHPPKRITCFPRYILSSRSMRTTIKMATKGTSAWALGVIRGINALPIIHIAHLAYFEARPSRASASYKRSLASNGANRVLISRCYRIARQLVDYYDGDARPFQYGKFKARLYPPSGESSRSRAYCKVRNIGAASIVRRYRVTCSQ